jgi:hypothetical protein
MTLFLFALVFRVVAELVRLRNTREAKPESLCSGCSHAHVQYGANGRRVISYTYGGAVRPMKLDVLYCTDYNARNLPSRAGAIGFVYEIAAAESRDGRLG